MVPFKNRDMFPRRLLRSLTSNTCHFLGSWNSLQNCSCNHNHFSTASSETNESTWVRDEPTRVRLQKNLVINNSHSDKHTQLWRLGSLVYWSTGLLVYWSTGLLVSCRSWSSSSSRTTSVASEAHSLSARWRRWRLVSRLGFLASTCPFLFTWPRRPPQELYENLDIATDSSRMYFVTEFYFEIVYPSGVKVNAKNAGKEKLGPDVRKCSVCQSTAVYVNDNLRQCPLGMCSMAGVWWYPAGGGEGFICHSESRRFLLGAGNEVCGSRRWHCSGTLEWIPLQFLSRPSSWH